MSSTHFLLTFLSLQWGFEMQINPNFESNLVVNYLYGPGGSRKRTRIKSGPSRGRLAQWKSTHFAKFFALERHSNPALSKDFFAQNFIPIMRDFEFSRNATSIKSKKRRKLLLQIPLSEMECNLNKLVLPIEWKSTLLHCTTKLNLQSDDFIVKKDPVTRVSHLL